MLFNNFLKKSINNNQILFKQKRLSKIDINLHYLLFYNIKLHSLVKGRIINFMNIFIYLMTIFRKNIFHLQLFW